MTHIDINRRRRRMNVRNVSSRAAALAWVEQLFGDGWYVAAVHVIEAR
ncbi:hypothetical protein [Paracidovorax avenae]|nr:hypothetical protein [Paracidovorax avenae]